MTHLLLGLSFNYGALHNFLVCCNDFSHIKIVLRISSQITEVMSHTESVIAGYLLFLFAPTVFMLHLYVRTVQVLRDYTGLPGKLASTFSFHDVL